MAAASSKLYAKGPRIEREPEGKMSEEKGNKAGAPMKAFKHASDTAKKAVPEADMHSDKGPKDDVMDGTDRTMAKHDDMKAMHKRHREEHMRMSERHARDMADMHRAHHKEMRDMGEESASEDGPSGGMEDKEIGKGGVEPKE